MRFIKILIILFFLYPAISHSASKPEIITLRPNDIKDILALVNEFPLIKRDIENYNANREKQINSLKISYWKVIEENTKKEFGIISFGEALGVCGAQYCNLYVYELKNDLQARLLLQTVSPHEISYVSCNKKFYLFWRENNDLTLHELEKNHFSKRRINSININTDKMNECDKAMYYSLFKK